MFLIYGTNGPLFEGSLEKLGSLARVNRRNPVGAVRKVDTPYFRGEATETTRQALRAYQNMLPNHLERGPLYHANQIMVTEVITLSTHDAVEKALQTLLKHQIHQAPVLDAEFHLVGIVSDRDLLKALNVKASRVGEALLQEVGEVMTTPVVAANPLTDIRRIVQVMLEQGVEGVPIVNESGYLCGFISRTDILNAVVKDPPLSTWR